MRSFASPTRHRKIVVKQGDDHPLVFPVPDIHGLPLDCSGWTARAVAADRKGVALYEWSTELGNAECGPHGVTLFTDESASWEWVWANFDVVAIAPDGAQRIPADGVIEVKKLWSR